MSKLRAGLPSRIWPLMVICGAVAVALLAVREQSLRSPSDGLLGAMRGLWSDHPVILKDQLLQQATIAATKGGSIGEPAIASARRLMRSDPLNAVSPLVLGAEQQIVGNSARSLSFYKLAVAHEPRNVAARILLADGLLRSGEVDDALLQMSVLSRLHPTAPEQVQSALVQFAKTPGAVFSLRRFIASNPEMGHGLLAKLADESSNFALVEQLSPSAPGGADAAPWQIQMVNVLVRDGKIDQARDYWSKITGNSLRGVSIFNPDFAQLGALGPFNWEVSPGPGGDVQIDGRGGLTILHYGRDEITLARQLVALPPGENELRTIIDGNADTANIGWEVRCMDGREIGRAMIAPAGEIDASIQVPDNCPYQWLELEARLHPSGKTSEFRIRKIEIVRRLP